MKLGTYRLLYRLGITPWAAAGVPPELTELVEGTDALPPGRALDVGCGTGVNTIYLAQHGWQVTGVDALSRPLEEANRKAASAGVQPTWIQGDVTHLAELGTGTDFDLVLDIGCLHGLPAEQRAETARQVTALARPGATFLLAGFGSSRRGPLPSGMGEDEVAQLFGGEWEIVRQRTVQDIPMARVSRKTGLKVYRLRRK